MCITITITILCLDYAMIRTNNNDLLNDINRSCYCVHLLNHFRVQLFSLWCKLRRSATINFKSTTYYDNPEGLPYLEPLIVTVIILWRRE